MTQPHLVLSYVTSDPHVLTITAVQDAGSAGQVKNALIDGSCGGESFVGTLSPWVRKTGTFTISLATGNCTFTVVAKESSVDGAPVISDPLTGFVP
jgi:hypothetical protein